MSNLPSNALDWQAFSRMIASGMPDQPLSMLAKWGTEQENVLRDYGSRIQSPIVSPDSKLNFEQRVLNPNSYPSINNGDGSVSTHRMAWGGDAGNYMAFPTIVQGKDGKLIEMDGKQAMDYAQKSGEYRKFTKPEDAESYAEGGYKKFWGLGEKK